jgi:hypothetical protein
MWQSHAIKTPFKDFLYSIIDVRIISEDITSKLAVNDMEIVLDSRYDAAVMKGEEIFGLGEILKLNTYDLKYLQDL